MCKSHPKKFVGVGNSDYWAKKIKDFEMLTNILAF